MSKIHPLLTSLSYSFSNGRNFFVVKVRHRKSHSQRKTCFSSVRDNARSGSGVALSFLSSSIRQDERVYVARNIDAVR